MIQKDMHICTCKALITSIQMVSDFQKEQVITANIATVVMTVVLCHNYKLL